MAHLPKGTRFHESALSKRITDRSLAIIRIIDRYRFIRTDDLVNLAGRNEDVLFHLRDPRLSTDKSAIQRLRAISKAIFQGWAVEKICELNNGQIWKQSTYHYHYHYAYRTKVLIYSSTTGCRMKVDGDDDDGTDVQRIK